MLGDRAVRALWLHLLPLGVLLLWACTADDPAAPQGPRLLVEAGAGQSDTIEAMPAQGLVVRVQDAQGEPFRDTPVEFRGRDGGMRFATSVAGGLDVRPTLSVRTDSYGQAAVGLRYGSVPGTARVEVEVPAAALRDSVSFEVLPGRPASLGFAEADPAVLVDSLWPGRPEVRDRLGNLREDPVRLESSDAEVARVDGGQVRGRRVGAVMVRSLLDRQGGAGPLRDSVRVTVVPAWTLAVPVRGGSMELRDLRGEARPIVGLAAQFPSWFPDGASFAFVADGAVWRGYPDGTRELVVRPPLSHLGRTAVGPDGSAVYFEASDPATGHAGIYHVLADGSRLRRVTPAAWRTTSPSLSPDGRFLAYRHGEDLVVRELATRSRRVVMTRPHLFPVWSPTGEWLSFVTPSIGGFALWVVRADGSEVRPLGHHPVKNFGMSWSRDGRWILAYHETATLVDVEAGTMLDLSWGRWPDQARGTDWRPR